MQFNFELIVGVALGLENFLDDELGSAWVVSLLIIRVIIVTDNNDYSM